MKQNVRVSKDYERWIILPDLQIPYDDKRTLTSIINSPSWISIFTFIIGLVNKVCYFQSHD